MVKKSHQKDVLYYAACLEPGCVENFGSETNRRLNKRVINSNGRDKRSHIYKHCQESNHPSVTLGDFKIIGTNFRK